MIAKKRNVIMFRTSLLINFRRICMKKRKSIFKVVAILLMGIILSNTSALAAINKRTGDKFIEVRNEISRIKSENPEMGKMLNDVENMMASANISKELEYELRELDEMANKFMEIKNKYGIEPFNIMTGKANDIAVKMISKSEKNIKAKSIYYGGGMETSHLYAALAASGSFSIPMNSLMQALAALLAYIGGIIGGTIALPAIVLFAILTGVFVFAVYAVIKISQNIGIITSAIGSTLKMNSQMSLTVKKNIRNLSDVNEEIERNPDGYFKAYAVSDNDMELGIMGGIVVLPGAMTLKGAVDYVRVGNWTISNIGGLYSLKDFVNIFTLKRKNALVAAGESALKVYGVNAAVSNSEIDAIASNPFALRLPHFHIYDRRYPYGRRNKHVTHFFYGQ